MMNPGTIITAVLMALAAACLLVMAYLFASLPAEAHSLFTGLYDPETHKGCCNDADCKQVPDAWVDAGVITPWEGGYRIRLTLEQARYFNPNMREPVDALFPGERVLWVLPYRWALCLNPSDESAMPAYSGHRVRCLLGAATS